MYSSMAKGTSRAEAVLNSKKLAIAIVELRESKGIRQAVSQSVRNFIKYSFLNSVATF